MSRENMESSGIALSSENQPEIGSAVLVNNQDIVQEWTNPKMLAGFYTRIMAKIGNQDVLGNLSMDRDDLMPGTVSWLNRRVFDRSLRADTAGAISEIIPYDIVLVGMDNDSQVNPTSVVYQPGGNFMENEYHVGSLTYRSHKQIPESLSFQVLNRKFGMHWLHVPIVHFSDSAEKDIAKDPVRVSYQPHKTVGSGSELRLFTLPVDDPEIVAANTPGSKPFPVQALVIFLDAELEDAKHRKYQGLLLRM